MLESGVEQGAELLKEHKVRGLQPGQADYDPATVSSLPSFSG